MRRASSRFALQGRKKGDDDDWEDEAAELNAEMLLKDGGDEAPADGAAADGAAAAEPEGEAGGKQKKLSNKVRAQSDAPVLQPCTARADSVQMGRFRVRRSERQHLGAAHGS